MALLQLICNIYFSMLKMTDRDPRHQRHQRGGAKLSDVDSHSPKAVGVGERTYVSPIRVPLTGVDSTSFMPTLNPKP